MHLRVTLFAFVIALVTVCNAAPHFLNAVSHQGWLRDLGEKFITQADLDPTDASTFQTTGQVTDDISNDGSSDSSNLSEFESSENMPFRRDLASAVADNINILIEPKHAADTDGFVDFARAVASSVYNSKRSLTKWFTRGEDGSEGSLSCGQYCIKKRRNSKRSLDGLFPRGESFKNMPYRPDLASVVADNIDILIEPKSATNTNGFVDLARAIARSGYNIKRSLAGLFSRGEDNSNDKRSCGRDCIKKRTVIKGSIGSKF